MVTYNPGAIMKRLLIILTFLSFEVFACTKVVPVGSSIQTSVSSAKAGDVICLRGGTYKENNVWVEASGTASQRIVIQAYPGETPVLDGAGIAGRDWTTFFTLSGQYIDLSGITLKNGVSKGAKGVWLRGANNTVRGMTIDNVQAQAILVSADNAIVENNYVVRAVMANKDCAQCSPPSWGFGIGSYIDYASNRTVKGMVLRGNTVHDSWGEGLHTFQSVGALVENNLSYDNFVTNFYIVASVGATVRNNISYSTPGKKEVEGITLSDEHNFIKSAGNTVTGNYVFNAPILLYNWTVTPGSGLQSVTFAHNSLIDSELLIGWTGRYPDTTHRDTVIRDNLFYNSTGGSTGSNHWTKGITYQRNLWYPNRPPRSEGVGDILPR
jgi:hypothetical protein